MDRSIFIDGVAFSTGEAQSIYDIPEVRSDAKVMEFFERNNVRKFRKSLKSGIELALESAEKTLACTKVGKEEIDGLIMVTSTIWRDKEGYLKAGNISEKLGLSGGFYFGLTLNACATFSSAIVIARALLVAGTCRNILIICTDKAEDTKRILEGNLSVLSDASSSCIMTSLETGYELQFSECVNDAVLWRLDPGINPVPFMMGMSRVIRTFTERYTCCMDDNKWLITNNYNKGTLDFINEAFGHKFSDKVLIENISEYGHCYASDIMINLKKLEDENCLKYNDQIVFFTSGFGSFGICGVKKK